MELAEFAERFDSLSDEYKRGLMTYTYGFIKSAGKLDGLVETLEVMEELNALRRESK